MDASQNARILVVDDDSSARAGLESLLQSEAFQVITAENGEDALERVAEQVPDVVVTDLWMPKMTGLELLGKLRGLHPGLPVIVVTAFDDADRVDEVMRAGAFDCQKKPVDVDELETAIVRALRRRNKRS